MASYASRAGKKAGAHKGGGKGGDAGRRIVAGSHKAGQSPFWYVHTYMPADLMRALGYEVPQGEKRALCRIHVKEAADPRHVEDWLAYNVTDKEAVVGFDAEWDANALHAVGVHLVQLAVMRKPVPGHMYPCFSVLLFRPPRAGRAAWPRDLLDLLEQKGRFASVRVIGAGTDEDRLRLENCPGLRLRAIDVLCIYPRPLGNKSPHSLEALSRRHLQMDSWKNMYFPTPKGTAAPAPAPGGEDRGSRDELSTLEHRDDDDDRDSRPEDDDDEDEGDEARGGRVRSRHRLSAEDAEEDDEEEEEEEDGWAGKAGKKKAAAAGGGGAKKKVGPVAPVAAAEVVKLAMSKWSGPLTNAMREYAALDAAATLALFLRHQFQAGGSSAESDVPVVVQKYVQALNEALMAEQQSQVFHGTVKFDRVGLGKRHPGGGMLYDAELFFPSFESADNVGRGQFEVEFRYRDKIYGGTIASVEAYRQMDDAKLRGKMRVHVDGERDVPGLPPPTAAATAPAPPPPAAPARKREHRRDQEGETHASALPEGYIRRKDVEVTARRCREALRSVVHSDKRTRDMPVRRELLKMLTHAAERFERIAIARDARDARDGAASEVSGGAAGSTGVSDEDLAPPDATVEEMEERALEVDEEAVRAVEISLPNGRVMPLNAVQSAVVLRARTHPLTVAVGPPGTGKTQTLTACAIDAKLRYRESTVLIATPSNRTADDIAKRVQRDAPHLNVTRLNANSRPQPADEDLKPLLARTKVRALVDATFREDPRNAELRELRRMLAAEKLSAQEHSACLGAEEPFLNEVLDRSDVIVVTCVTAGGSRLRDRMFDVVLVDEATRCNVAEGLIPLVRARRHCVVIGDNRQMGPIVVTSDRIHKEALLYSHFDALLHAHRYHLLRDQYRMHESIARMPNQLFYSGKLVSHASPSALMTNVPCAQRDSRVFFVDVRGDVSVGDTNSRRNQAEVDEVSRLVTCLLSLTRARPQTVMVITPYVAQKGDIIAALGAKARSIQDSSHDASVNAQAVVSTIDAAQGSEADYVILSLTASSQGDEKGTNAGFARDPKRTNVALTRARVALFIIGDQSLFGNAAWMPYWSKVIDYCHEQRRLVRPGFDLLVAVNDDDLVERESGCVRRTTRPSKPSIHSATPVPQTGPRRALVMPATSGGRYIPGLAPVPIAATKKRRRKATNTMSTTTAATPGAGLDEDNDLEEVFLEEEKEVEVVDAEAEAEYLRMLETAAKPPKEVPQEVEFVPGGEAAAGGGGADAEGKKKKKKTKASKAGADAVVSSKHPDELSETDFDRVLSEYGVSDPTATMLPRAKAVPKETTSTAEVASDVMGTFMTTMLAQPQFYQELMAALKAKNPALARSFKRGHVNFDAALGYLQEVVKEMVAEGLDLPLPAAAPVAVPSEPKPSKAIEPAAASSAPKSPEPSSAFPAPGAASKSKAAEASATPTPTASATGKSKPKGATDAASSTPKSAEPSSPAVSKAAEASATPAPTASVPKTTKSKPSKSSSAAEALSAVKTPVSVSPAASPVADTLPATASTPVALKLDSLFPSSMTGVAERASAAGMSVPAVDVPAAQAAAPASPSQRSPPSPPALGSLGAGAMRARTLLAQLHDACAHLLLSGTARPTREQVMEELVRMGAAASTAEKWKYMTTSQALRSAMAVNPTLVLYDDATQTFSLGAGAGGLVRSMRVEMGMGGGGSGGEGGGAALTGCAAAEQRLLRGALIPFA